MPHPPIVRLVAVGRGGFERARSVFLCNDLEQSLDDSVVTARVELVPAAPDHQRGMPAERTDDGAGFVLHQAQKRGVGWKAVKDRSRERELLPDEDTHFITEFVKGALFPEPT